MGVRFERIRRLNALNDFYDIVHISSLSLFRRPTYAGRSIVELIDKSDELSYIHRVDRPVDRDAHFKINVGMREDMSDYLPHP